MGGRRGRKSRARRKNSEKEKEKGKEKENPSWSMSVLPHDLIGDILLRLSMKKIIQCRCVCKTWNDLVLGQESDVLKSIRARDTLVLQTFDNGICLVELERGRGEVMKANLPKGKLELVGSCNGLICLVNEESEKSVYVCNPMTGEYIQTTPPKPRKEKSFYINEAYGFGFCPMSNQYKVIRVIKKSYQSEGEIFTLGSDKWRSIGDTPYPCCSEYFGVPLNGAVHWIANHELRLNGDFGFICALDIDSEKISPISPPPNNYRNNGIFMLGVLGECLCISEDRYFHGSLEIWVMKIYGVKESWTKDIIITWSVTNDPWASPYIKPRMILKDGDILVSQIDYDPVYTKTLRLYNPTRKSLSDINIKGVPPYTFEAVNFVVNFGSLRDIVNKECTTVKAVNSK